MLEASFRDKKFFLSNMYPAPILFNGVNYSCSESAYRGEKCLYEKDKVKVSNMNGFEAKRFIKTAPKKELLSEEKIKLMYEILCVKFNSHKDLLFKLSEIPDEELVEYNSWGDKFWGVDIESKEGKNILGKLLQKIKRDNSEYKTLKIVSASRRTDIPAFHSKSFVEKTLPTLAKNNFVVFWTKDFSSMMKYLDILKDTLENNFYVQFTLTGYDKDIEPHLPEKFSYLVDVFQRLSDSIGKNRVVWRYDPIFLSEKYNYEYHINTFKRLFDSLSEYTTECTVSFIDVYEKLLDKGFNSVPLSVQNRMLNEFLEINQGKLKLSTCAESILVKGVEKSHCISAERISEIVGYKIENVKDKQQRKECGCIPSVDIGKYGTCSHGCLYCYAN